jgi:CRP-like cAMP-binding protein
MKGQVIGNLIKEKYNDDSTYICIDNCDITQLNKNNSKLEKLYSLIIEKKRKSLAKLKNNLLIFNLLNENFFYNEVIPHLEYRQYHQGEKIFIQGSIYKGIYLVTDGEVNIYLNSSINEIGNFILNITNSLNQFKEYVSNLNKIGYSKEFNESAKPKIMKDKTNLDKEKVDSLNKKKKIDILNISQYKIFGTNELYDNNNGFYYFSAECASKEAIIYFLPHKYFYSLLIREKPIYLSLAEMIEFRAKDIIGRLEYHIKCFNNVMNKASKRFIETNNITNINNKNVSYNNYMTSLKYLNIKKVNKKIALRIRNEKPYEFPPLMKDKNSQTIKEYNNKTSYIANETIGSFSFKNKYDLSFRDKIFNQYKKNKLMSINPNTNNISLYNRKIKINDRKINLSERANKIKNFKIYLPNNFPFKIQNSFYDSNPIKIEKKCISKSPIILKYKQ